LPPVGLGVIDPTTPPAAATAMSRRTTGGAEPAAAGRPGRPAAYPTDSQQPAGYAGDQAVRAARRAFLPWAAPRVGPRRHAPPALPSASPPVRRRFGAAATPRPTPCGGRRPR